MGIVDVGDKSKVGIVDLGPIGVVDVGPIAIVDVGEGTHSVTVVGASNQF